MQDENSEILSNEESARHFPQTLRINPVISSCDFVLEKSFIDPNPLKLNDRRIVSSFPFDNSRIKSSIMGLQSKKEFNGTKSIKVGKFFNLYNLSRLVKGFIKTLMELVFHRFISNLNEKSFKLIDDKSSSKFSDLKALFSLEGKRFLKKAKKSDKRNSTTASNFIGPRNTVLNKILIRPSKRQSWFSLLFSFFHEKIFHLFKSFNENYPVFSENSRLSKALYIINISSLMFALFIFPIEVGFSVSLSEYFYSKNHFFGVLYHIFIKIFLWIQIFSKLNCSTIIDGEEIYERTVLIRNYFHQSLFRDLISIVAIYVGVGFTQTNFLAMLILIKYKDINDFSVEFEENSSFSERSDAIYRLVKLITKILFIAHIISCMWFLLGNSDTGEDRNWVQDFNQKFFIKSFIQQYVASFYWSVTTIVTVGYGDIVPLNVYERFFTVVVILIGCGLFGYSLNLIGNIIDDYSAGESEYREVVKIMNRTLKKKKLPASIFNKVRKYLRYSWKEELAIEKEKILMNKLPNSLKKEIFQHTNSQILNHINFLKENFSSSFLNTLKQHFEQIKVAPEENIIKEGGFDDRSIYVIFNGTATLYHSGSRGNKDHVVKILREKDSFGELSFITGCPRSASIKSNGFCIVYKLSYERFHQVLSYFPKDLEIFFMVRDRIKINQENSLLRATCYSCSRNSHYSKECPYFSRVSKKRILRRCELEEKGINKRRKFMRKNVSFRIFKEDREISDHSEHTDEKENKLLSSNHILPSNSQLGISIDQNLESISGDCSINHSILSRAELIGGDRNQIYIKLPRGSIDRRSIESESRQTDQSSIIHHRILENENEKLKELLVSFEAMKNYKLYFPSRNLSNLLKSSRLSYIESMDNFENYNDVPKISMNHSNKRKLEKLQISF